MGTRPYRWNGKDGPLADLAKRAAIFAAVVSVWILYTWLPLGYFPNQGEQIMSGNTSGCEARTGFTEEMNPTGGKLVRATGAWCKARRLEYYAAERQAAVERAIAEQVAADERARVAAKRARIAAAAKKRHARFVRDRRRNHQRRVKAWRAQRDCKLYPSLYNCDGTRHRIPRVPTHVPTYRPPAYVPPAYHPPAYGGSLCSDGTLSPSTGSGTCSWHGGISGGD